MNFKSVLSNFTGGAGGEKGDTSNIIKIGDNQYKFDVFLWNGETKTGITYTSIQELKIVDDLRYFFSYGYMTFNDNNDFLESFDGAGDGKKIIPYTFRGDGRDYLQIEIMPQIHQNDENVSESSEKEKQEFCLKYTFSVYKIEEEMMEDRGVKYKKLYFWDTDYQFLNEMNSNFSTSEVTLSKENSIPQNNKGGSTTASTTQENKKVKNTDDFKRYTGDSIKALLKKCLSEKTTIGFKASKEWDKGGTLLEHSTNGTSKAIDDLQYLMQYHVSDKSYDYVPCILKKTRYTEEYTLIPITTYLKNTIYTSGGITGGLASGLAGMLGGGRGLSEDFYIGKLDTGGDAMGNVFKNSSKASQNSFNGANYNIIENYSFLKPDVDIIQKDVSTHFVHSYDPDGFFTCSIKSNNFKNSKKSIFNDNVKSLSDSPNGGTYDILPSNQLREENMSVQHVYASGLGIGQDFQKLNFGRNKSLLASIFKNTAIYFRARGLTRRKSGTFFTVNRLDNQTKNDHDKAVLGKYFTTLVIHEFKKGMYYNHVYGVKSTTNEKQKFAEML
jgi:chitodextrinase